MNLARKLQGASAVLVVRGDDEAQWDPFPTSLTTADPATTRVVLISRKPTLAPFLSRWNHLHDDSFERLCSVIIGGSFRRGKSRAQTLNTSARVSLEAIASPADLTDLGVLVDEYVRNWERSSKKTLVVHSSLTPVLQYVDLQSLFKFVVVLRACLQNTGSLGIFYIDGDAHEERTIGTLRTAFDAVVTESDGRWNVQYS
jgi:hypothetical protein